MLTKRIDALQQIGCICCRTLGFKTPPEIHHIVRNMRRIGDDFTLPLCAYHHRGVRPVEEFAKMSFGTTQNIFGVARHVAGRKAFEKQWGPEKDLLKEVNELIGDTTALCERYDCFQQVPDEGEYCHECRTCMIEDACDSAMDR